MQVLCTLCTFPSLYLLTKTENLSCIVEVCIGFFVCFLVLAWTNCEHNLVCNDAHNTKTFYSYFLNLNTWFRN